MAQEIKIPVQADTAAARRNIDGLADSFDGVAAGAKRMAAGVKAAADQTKNLAAAREYARKLGLSLSDAEAATVADNFTRAQRKGPYAKNFRNFSDMGGWDKGQDALYKTQREAQRARSYANQRLFEGTGAAGSGGPPAMPPGGGGRSGEGEASAGVKRIQQQALSFSKSMLALAGIGSVIALAAKAKDLATEEAVGTDTLKRRLGDLGVSFDNLRDQARSAGQGLGITYVESMRLGSAYSKEVGNLTATDLKGQGFSHMMRGQYGFSRSYGIDPAEGTQFFGQMAKYGIGRDEQGQRKLALLIGDSVARNGYGGKVEDLLHAVADYTASAARMTLSAPNSEAYVNALTSLVSSGRPGLDPANAAAILGAADSSIRRGGAMGDASLNFSYAALRNGSPGIRPVDAMALMQGGLFGTTRNTFGPGSPLSGWVGKGVALDDKTNLDKMIPLLLKQYGHNGFGLRAIQNQFGLNSMAQAAALAGMSDGNMLGGMSTMLKSAHIDPMTVNASGLGTLGKIAGAKGRGGLMGIYADLMKRDDLTAAQKQRLTAAVSGAGGNDLALRNALATSAASFDQEKTPGSEVRDSIANLTDLLTQAGGPLMSVLNPIRDAVVAIAGMIVPGYMDTTGSRPEGAGTGKGAAGAASRRGGANQAAIEQDAVTFFMTKGWSREQAAAIVGREITESGIDPHALGDGGHAIGVFQWHADRWKKYKKWAADNGISDLYDMGAQWGFQNYELTEGDEKQSGWGLKHARNTRERAMAMLASARPGGWHYYNQNHPEEANGWKDQLANTQRLEGAVDVRLHAPDGSKKTVKVPLIGKPKAAGTSNPFLSAPSADPFALPTGASLIK